MVAPSGTSAHWRGLAELLRPHRRRYLVLGAVLGVASSIPLLSPLIVGRVVDRAAEGAELEELTALAAALVAVGLVGQAVAVLVAWFATRTAWQTTNELRLELADHVLALDHEFHRSHTAGELVQRIDGDVTAVSDFLSQVVVKIGGAVVTVAGMVVVLTLLDWRIGLAMAVYVAVAFAAVGSRRNHAVEESSDELSAHARLYGGIEERLAASEDLRSNGGGAYAVQGFVDHSVEVAETAVARERAYLRVWRIVSLGIASGAVLSILGGGVLGERGVITVGPAWTSTSGPGDRSGSAAGPGAARPRAPASCCASSRRPGVRSASAAAPSPTCRSPSCVDASRWSPRRSNSWRGRCATT